MKSLKSAGVQALIALALAGAAFTGAGLLPAAAAGLNMVGASLLGFAAGRPMKAGQPAEKEDE